MGPGWTYTQEDRYHHLKNENVKWRVLREDMEAELGEEREEEAEETSKSDDMETGGVSGSQHGGWDYSSDYASYYGNWAYMGSINEVMERHRPWTYINWSEESRALFDHQTFMGAHAARAEKE